MNVKKRIKQLGIENITDVEKEDKANLSSNVANLLVNTFPNSRLNKQNIENKLLDTNMYIASIPKRLARVNYIYMNSAIYFDRSLNLQEINEEMLHECIHKIQEFKKKKRLIRLGICNFKDIKIVGLGMNEAAVHYIVSKTLNNEKKNIKVYGIELPQNKEGYYSLVTNLIQQIVYLIGDETLVDSTINCNDEFIYKCIDNFGESTFFEIRNNFDKLLSINDNISKLIKEHTQNDEIKLCINNLKTVYTYTQELILTSYFKLLLERINQLKEVDMYREKLIGYGEFVGRTESYDFYERYIKMQLLKLIQKEEIIKKKTTLMVVSNNPITKVYNLIRKLFTKKEVKVE